MTQKGLEGSGGDPFLDGQEEKKFKANPKRSRTSKQND